jgi:hypothetical protein
MLPAVTLVEQWREVESRLPSGWPDARLHLLLDDEAQAGRAAALLGPAMPGRSGRDIRFFCARHGAGVGPESVRRMLQRLDAERIAGRLELVATGEPAAQPETARRTLAASWDAELAALPPDWSDLYAEVELTSTDYLERAALLLSPVNPGRYGGVPGFRFRCSRTFGYGVSAEMARRGLARLDEEGIRGAVQILYALSDTHPVGTQGPVFRLEGRAV